MDKINDYNINTKLILAQFQSSDNLKGIIEAGNNSANDIETALFEIQDNIYLDVAIGAQLDIIGAVFDVDRAGKNDTEYRIAIQLKAGLTYSGEPESIIQILKSQYGATEVIYRPFYPGKYYIYTDIPIDRRVLDVISPAGVLGYMESMLVDGNGNFLIDGNNNFVTAVFQSI